MKQFSINLLLILLAYNAVGQDNLILYITKVNEKSSSIELSLSNLDLIINKGKITKIIDSNSTYQLENQGYLKNKYLKILDHMPSGQATFSVYEFKIIDFNNFTYLLYSKKEGLSEPCGSFILDSLTTFRIEDKKLILDNTLKSIIEGYRKYKYFTDDKELLERTHKDDFCYDLLESKENEVLIEFNLGCSSFKEIEEKLKGSKLKLQFENGKIETILTEN